MSRIENIEEEYDMFLDFMSWDDLFFAVKINGEELDKAKILYYLAPQVYWDRLEDFKGDHAYQCKKCEDCFDKDSDLVDGVCEDCRSENKEK